MTDVDASVPVRRASALDGAASVRIRITVRGVVQGVGFRPFVARLAAELGVAGFCGNDQAGVFVEAEAGRPVLDRFVGRLRDEAPPLARVIELTSRTIPPSGRTGFRIVESRAGRGRRTLVPPDTATCPDCLRELADPADRRYRHPFISCTNCGPRFTIITDLPYDRPATTMAGFPLCDRCAAEYTDPLDRRFHAQPVACHDCGPQLRLELDGAIRDGGRHGDDDVLAAVHAALAAGRILAIKGVGGFHLACSAGSADAVRRLRARKHRPDKPFALMVRDLRVAQRLARVGPVEAGALSSAAAPIVLLERRRGAPVADAVAPGLRELGVMLPYTPLHHLLFASVPGSDRPPPDVLVMTSANLAGEPLCWQDDDARARMAGIADGFLWHDRPIAVPCEDSIVAVADGTEVVLRRSRGLAPLPTQVPHSDAVVLAVGAELKNTVTIAGGTHAYTSAHLGDMSTLEAREAFLRSVDHLLTLHALTPQAVAADLHPGFLTSRWAAERAEDTGVPLVAVQHHHAHLASLLAEHGRVGERALGVVFDGTGLGCDRHVWGGEILAIGADIGEAERVGHLEEFPLPGGDIAVRQPFRVALALLHHARLAPGRWRPAGVSEAAMAVVASQLTSGTACVPTSSVGRLFDGVASLLGLRHEITYEAQAAIELETAAATASAPHPLRLPVQGAQLMVRPLIADIVAARDAGVPAARIARGFHAALAEATALLVTGLARDRNVSLVGLSGGVFANRILSSDLANALRRTGFEVLTHRHVPGNDGGLALGQVVVARALLSGPSAGRS